MIKVLALTNTAIHWSLWWTVAVLVRTSSGSQFCGTAFNEGLVSVLQLGQF